MKHNELLINKHELGAISLLAKDMNEYCYSYLNKYAANIIADVEEEEDEQLLKYGNKIIIDMISQECTHELLTCSMEYVNSSSMTVADKNKIIALSLISAFVLHTKNDLSDNIAQLINGILQLFMDDNESIRLTAWNTLKDLMSTIPETEVIEYIDWYRQCIRTLSNNFKEIECIPGFCIKQGLKPIMTMFDYGIRNGTPEQRTNAAKLMCDLIQLSNLDAIKLSLNKIAGALIRICADRFPPNVKCAILQTLTLLISKYGALMKGFYTPLQTTFVKVIQDPNTEIRNEASIAILELITYSNKVDNLLRDLNNYLKKTENLNENKPITISVLRTMADILLSIGSKKQIKAAILNDIKSTFIINAHDFFKTERDDSLRFYAAKCAASVACCLSNEAEKEQIIVSLLDVEDEDEADWRSIEYDLNSLAFIINNNNKMYTFAMHESYGDDIEKTFEPFLGCQSILVAIAALRIGYYLIGQIANFDASQMSKDEKLNEICNLLKSHLLPILKKNHENEDIVVSSIEFLLESILVNGEDQNEDEEEE